MDKQVIDVENESLGRVASKIAHLLQGKDKPSFERNRVIDGKVVVKNAHLVNVSGRKAEQKIYYRHSGRPGHLKKTTYKAAFAKNPEWVIRYAVNGMLPKNRLQSERIKKLEFEEKNSKSE